MAEIRAFEPTDEQYAAIIAIDMACFPEYPSTIEEWRHSDDSRDPKYLYRRVVAVEGDEIVGFGAWGDPAWSMKPGKYFVEAFVHPDHRRRGIGRSLYEHATRALAANEPTLLVSHTREDQVDGIAFLERRGFALVQREPVSELDIAAFDPAPFEPYAERAVKEGIKILSLAELRERYPDWKERYYDVHWEGLRDVPSPDPITRQSFETFAGRLFSNPGFIPEAHFVAVDGEEWVGLSQLWKSQADEERLFTGLTGVARSHRRKGLAMAMKLRALAFARDYGARLIETDNDENNPMYQINLKLGFVPRPAWVSYHKPLGVVEGEGSSERVAADA